MRKLGVLLLAALTSQLPTAFAGVCRGHGAPCGHACCRRWSHCEMAARPAPGSDCRMRERCSAPPRAVAGDPLPRAVLTAAPRSSVPAVSTDLVKGFEESCVSLHVPEPPTPPPRLRVG